MNSANAQYVPRVIDGELDAYLQAVGAVVIEGPKACGKTAPASQWAGSMVNLDRDSNALRRGQVSPHRLLQGTAPVVLDEWQLLPDLWNAVRHEVDDRSPEKDLFILTGNSTPDDDARRHSGAGRFARLRMRPMALCEQGLSSSEVSLANLMRGEEPQGMGAPLDIETLMSVLVTGGWPALLDTNVDAAMLVNQGYADQIVEIDVHRLLGTRRDPVKLRRVIQALARCVGNQRSVTKLAAEAGGTDGSLDRDTVSTYLDELTRLRILEDLPAWNAHLRSHASLM